jgi:capsular polysaccharide transport system ATP-binding protein
MIILDNVTKLYNVKSGTKTVLRNANLRVSKGQCVGVLGRNGAGKSTLIRLLGGTEHPTSGTVTRSMSVSWPLAFGGAFQGSLTGLDNLKFVCRIYGADITKAARFVEDFADLGEYIHEPVKKYSTGMRSRLAFGISMAVNFDCYLIDEIIAVGDNRFHEKCHVELFENRRDSAKIIVSHNAHYILAHCSHVALIEDGELRLFDDPHEAVAIYSGTAAATTTTITT